MGAQGGAIQPQKDAQGQEEPVAQENVQKGAHTQCRKARKRRRCGDCNGCKKPKCQKCLPCLNPRWKKPCKERKCLQNIDNLNL